MADIFLVEAAQIGTGTSMATLAKWDSLAQIDLIAALEEEFGVTFDVEDFELMTDFATVVKTLSDKM